MKIFTFEVEFDQSNDYKAADYDVTMYGVVKLCGAEVYREPVNEHRVLYSSYPNDREEVIEDVLYHFGLKLGKLLKDQND